MYEYTTGGGGGGGGWYRQVDIMSPYTCVVSTEVLAKAAHINDYIEAIEIHVLGERVEIIWFANDTTLFWHNF